MVLSGRPNSCVKVDVAIVALRIIMFKPDCLYPEAVKNQKRGFISYREQSLKKELTLAGNTDITVAITEPMTGRAEVNLPIQV